VKTTILKVLGVIVLTLIIANHDYIYYLYFKGMNMDKLLGGGVLVAFLGIIFLASKKRERK